MPRNFDELLSKDRTFTVRGQSFTWRDVKPEVLTLFDSEAILGKNGDSDETAVWKLIDAQILLFIEPGQHESWAKLRAREEEPVTIQQLNAILEWLMEAQTGRPTETPSPSASGRGKTAASSKDA